MLAEKLTRRERIAGRRFNVADVVEVAGGAALAPPSGGGTGHGQGAAGRIVEPAEAAGLSVPEPYTAVWTLATNNATAGFGFNETCPDTSPLPPDPAPPATGRHRGSST